MHLKQILIGLFILVVMSMIYPFKIYPVSGQVNEQLNDILPNVVIIKFKEELVPQDNNTLTNNSALNDLLRENSILSIKPVLKRKRIKKSNPEISDMSKVYYGYFPGDTSPLEISRNLDESSYIEYAEPKYSHTLCTIPNDSLYGNQNKYFDLIKAPDVWDIIRGENGDIIIAVVDAGTDIRHSDLFDNIWCNEQEKDGIPNVDDDENGYIDDIYGWNFSTNSGDPTGIDSMKFNADHGTYVSGIISAVSNNIKGVAGMSWNATIMPVNTASESEDRVISYGYEGILYAAQNGADVINCSWGSSRNSDFGKDVISYAISVGAVVVGAAGNNGNTYPFYPSSYKNVIAVTATNLNDQLWDLSNFGEYVDIAAPGIDIFSTMADNRYGYATGTSAASALVSGSIGLMRIFNPEWNSIQILQQLVQTADIYHPESEQLKGKRINLYRAITEKPVSIQVLNHTYTDENGNQIIENGELISMNIQLINQLTPISNVTIILNSESEYIRLIKDKISVSSLGTLEQYAAEESFVFEVDKDIPNNINLDFNLHIKADGYEKQHNVFLENVINTTAQHRDASKNIHFHNYPNPFNAGTSIKFRLGRDANTSIYVFNNRGQKVLTLAQQYYPAGVHSIKWDGRDQRGNEVASGIYYLTISTNKFKSTKKMMLIR